jgi:hypothetical protein
MTIAAPALAVGGYWLTVDHRSGPLDWTLLAVALALGVAGIWSAPLRVVTKAAVTFVYVPLMGAALMAGLLAAECSTGNCL